MKITDSESYAQEMASALNELHGTISHCDRCHGLADDTFCQICKSVSRDTSRVCVVEGIPELMAIERSGEYDGLFHVLHGVLSPIKGVGPDTLKIKSLLERIDVEPISEVILATNVDVEGEATALFLQRQLSEKPHINVSRIATGVPMGGDLEYLDQMTVARALRDRRPY